MISHFRVLLFAFVVDCYKYCDVPDYPLTWQQEEVAKESLLEVSKTISSLAGTDQCSVNCLQNGIDMNGSFCRRLNKTVNLSYPGYEHCDPTAIVPDLVKKDFCRICPVRNVWNTYFHKEDTPILQQYCYCWEGGTWAIYPPSRRPNGYSCSSRPWVNLALTGPRNVVFLIDARWTSDVLEQTIRDFLSNYLFQTLSQNFDFVSLFVFHGSSLIEIPFEFGATCFSERLLLHTHLLSCFLEAWAQGKAAYPNLNLEFYTIGDEDASFLFDKAFQVLTNSNKWKTNCTMSNNIFFITAQDISDRGLAKIIHLYEPTNLDINLWIISSPDFTNLKTLSCWWKYSLLISLDGEKIMDTLVYYYSLFLDPSHVQMAVSDPYVSLLHKYTIKTFSIPILGPVSRLVCVCAIDIIVNTSVSNDVDMCPPISTITEFEIISKYMNELCSYEPTLEGFCPKSTYPPLIEIDNLQESSCIVTQSQMSTERIMAISISGIFLIMWLLTYILPIPRANQNLEKDYLLEFNK